MNAVHHLQSNSEAIIRHVDLFIWLDIIFGYESDPGTFIAKLNLALDLCRERGMKLNPSNCEFCVRVAQFYTRLIDSTGAKFNQLNNSGITSMADLNADDALMELVSGEKLMRTKLRFSKLIDLLHTLLESKYTLH